MKARIEDMSAEQYHALSRVSASAMKSWRVSADKGRDPGCVGGPEVDIGTLVHEMMERAGDHDAIVVRTPQRSGSVWHAAVKRGREEGKLVVTNEEYMRACDTYAGVMRNPIAAEIIHNSIHEMTLLWEEAGVEAKARVDLFHRITHNVYDLKTTTDFRALGNSDDVGKLIHDRNWDLQVSWYVRAARLAGMDAQGGGIILVSTKAAFTCEVVHLSDTFLKYGDAKYEDALERYARYLENPEMWGGPSVGPDGGPTIRVIEPPRWAKPVQASYPLRAPLPPREAPTRFAQQGGVRHRGHKVAQPKE